MKKIMLCIFLFFPLSGQAVQVRSVSVETTRMPPRAVQQRFHLKEGDLFTQAEYEKAKDELQ